MHDHAHTWKFNKDSKLIRTYLWAWEANPYAINFCKLFWGILFLPVAVFFHGAGYVMARVLAFVDRLIPKKPARPMNFEEAQDILRAKKTKIKTGPSKGELILAKIGAFFDRIAAFFQAHDTAVRVVFVTILGIVALGLAGGFVSLWIFFPITMLKILAYIVGIIIASAIVIVLIYWLDSSGNAKRFGNAVARKSKTTGRFLATGYHSVKYRTCPAIEVTGQEDGEGVVA